MAESAEHEFLKHVVNDILAQFARLELYSFTETDRKLFDFSSLIVREWRRPLIGQVLWGHADGIEKDFRTLTHDAESDIKVYVAKDTIRGRQAFAELIASYRNSGRHQDLFKLKPIWIPHDFDADRLADQGLVRDYVKSIVVNDILFNVVFGNLTAEDVAFLLSASGAFALQLAMLVVIATEGFTNITLLAKRLSVSAGPVRERLIILMGADMIRRCYGRCQVTPKGQVFLDIARRLEFARQRQVMDPELSFVLTKLDCAPVPWEVVDEDTYESTDTQFVELVKTIGAVERWLK